MDTVADPDDIGKIVVEAVKKKALRGFIGGETRVEYTRLDCVRDWKAQAEKLKVKLSGGIRDSTTGHHGHIFVSRRDVPERFRDKLPTTRGHNEARDIICLVKRWIGCSTLCQAPVIVLPHRAGVMPSLVPPDDAIVPRVPVKDKKKKSWLKLAEVYGDLHASQGPHRARAVRYLQELAHGRLGDGARPTPMPWHALAVDRVQIDSRCLETVFDTTLAVKPLRASWLPLPTELP